MSFRFTPWFARAALAMVGCAALGAALGMQWSRWYGTASPANAQTMVRRATGATFAVLGPDAAAFLQHCPPALISLGILLLQLAPVLALLTVRRAPAPHSLRDVLRDLGLAWCALQLACFAAFLALGIGMHAVISAQGSLASFSAWTGQWLWRSALAALPYVGLGTFIAQLKQPIWKRALLWCGGLLLQRLVSAALLHAAPWA
jgi:hypothetical protein